MFITDDENKLLPKRNNFLITYIEHNDTIRQYTTKKQIPTGMHVKIDNGQGKFDASSEQIKQVVILSEEEYQGILNQPAGCMGLGIFKTSLEKRILKYINRAL